MFVRLQGSEFVFFLIGPTYAVQGPHSTKLTIHLTQGKERQTRFVQSNSYKILSALAEACFFLRSKPAAAAACITHSLQACDAVNALGMSRVRERLQH